MINIKRERWVIIKSDKEILCGNAGNLHFKSMPNVGNALIKTYISEKSALSFFKLTWSGEELLNRGIVKAVKVIESIQGI